MNRVLSAAMIASLLALVLGCGSRAGSASRYTNANYGFSIEFPSGWSIREEQPPMAVVSTNKFRGSEDLFQESINVYVEEASENFDLVAYFEINIKNVGSMVDEFTVSDQGGTEVGGIPSKWALVHVAVGENKATNLQYYIVKGKRAYIVTCGAWPSEFSQFRPTFQRAIDTFKIE